MIKSDATSTVKGNKIISFDNCKITIIYKKTKKGATDNLTLA